MLTERDVIDRLRAAVHEAGSQKACAEKFGISQMYLSDVLNGRRSPGEKILDALGLEAQIVYKPKEEEQ